MVITLSSGGGFGAGIRRPGRVVDMSRLSAEESEAVTRLVAAARREKAPEGPGTVRDGMWYQIQVQGEGDEWVSTQSDGAMSEAFSALVDFVAGRS